MLLELRVQNLLLIERAELSLGSALNVITGETGAGKTMLTHALDLLLGGRPRRGLVRPNADEAYVEGVFAAPPAFADDPELAELRERLPLADEEIVLARRVTAEGRTRAYVQGRSASAHDLSVLGGRLVSFYGQHEHRRLTLASAQLDVLDSFCGQRHLDALAGYELAWARARDLRRERDDLRERAGARERDLDLLEFELGEIEQVAPDEGEEASLEAERARLGAVEALRQAAWGAVSALEPEEEPSAGGAVPMLAQAQAQLGTVQGTDAPVDELAQRVEALAYEAQDLSRELRAYAAALEADPERLTQVEERLELLARLKRKHGGTIAAVLEHAERCRGEHERLSSAEEMSARVETELSAATAELERLAQKLTSGRRKAARELERAVRVELAELAMGGASFEVSLLPKEAAREAAQQVPEKAAQEAANEGASPAGLGPHGAESVELMIAPNRGVPAGRLREIASGGELSRVMLALMSVATASGGAPTVVFDEVDAGVGGNTARAVGEKLRHLGERRQVLCITHLPQVASMADRHFRVEKESGDGLALARVDRLERSELVAELCRMLGADAGDGAARLHAERLLQAA